MHDTTDTANNIQADAAHTTNSPQIQVDATGLMCPLPLLRLKQALHQAPLHTQLTLIATDAMSQKDIPRFCELSGHLLCLQQIEQDESLQNANQRFIYIVKKMV